MSKSIGYPSITERKRLYDKAITLLRTGMTPKEFFQFCVSLDSDTHYEFILEYCGAEASKLFPEEFGE